jgi:predicted nucleotidyltransferase component of viral defense system
MPKDFTELVDIAMREPGRAAMRSVVEKEILHYDIFAALDSAGLLKDLVFQGGTSLRLCRGSNRFSEDLDFAGGIDFTAQKFAGIKSCIEKHIGDRYGLPVLVKEPKDMAAAPDHENVRVDKWQVSVQTSPQRRDIPQQKIKIEIANVPAHTRELVPLRQNYDFLSGYGQVLVNAERVDEIVADKVLAFAASQKNIRYRDIWDLAWLSQHGGKLDPAMVDLKVDNYGVEDYPNLLDEAIERLPELVEGQGFLTQMTRFIDAQTISRTLALPGFRDYLKSTVRGVLQEMAEHLHGRRKTHTFRM